MSGITITLYRRGERISLASHPEAEAVTVELADGVRVGETAMGEVRFYQRGSVYGRSFELALGEGWCRVVE